MPKKLACWVGRHSWTTVREKGESYKVCSACGKTPRGGKGNIEGHAYDHYPQMYDNP